MKHIKVFEQFLEESAVNEATKNEFPTGTQYKISVQFLDDDDRLNFIDTYDLEDRKSNWVDAYVDKKTLKKMVDDLKKVYGVNSKNVNIQVKGGGEWEIYNLDELPKGV